MRKRMASLFLVLALCLSLLSAAALAESIGSAAQEEQGGTNVGDVVGEDTALPGEDGSDEAVQAAQALIDALPDKVTADNAEEIEQQLMALDAALEALTEEQTAALDMTRYEILCAALAGRAAEQADGHNDHALCTHGSGCTICPADAKTKAFTNAVVLTSVEQSDKESTTCSHLYYGDSEAGTGYDDNFWYFELPGGSYYLGSDVKLSKAIRIPEGATVKLCLNGHSITKITNDNDGSEGVISIEKGGTLLLCDCNSSGVSNGKITHGTDADGTKYIGRGVRGGSSQGSGDPTFIMYSGEISGNTAGKSTNGQTQEGAGVEIYGGTFTMYGGKITDNRVTGRGGGLLVSGGGIFVMKGGEISNNTSGKHGGGVCVNSSPSNDTPFIMEGGVIRDNTATENGGGVCYISSSEHGAIISDSAKIENNKAASGGGIYVYYGRLALSGRITGNSVGEGGQGGGVYVGGLNRNYSGKFTLSDNAEISGNSTDGNGGGVYVGQYGTLTMTGGTIGGSGSNANTAAYGGGVYVNSGTVNMSGGEITGNDASKDLVAGTVNASGGGVYVRGTDAANPGKFTLSGTAKITGNRVGANGTGGGVFVYEYGTFNMNGGEISRNTANTMGGGGGVCLNLGTFNMTAGSITGNSTDGAGGGVFAADDSGTFTSKFTMTGGSITDNTAGSGGGGIFANTYIDISGTPKVSGNTADSKQNNVQLNGINLLRLTAALQDGAEIYITPADTPPVNVACSSESYDVKEDDAAKFHADDESAGYEFVLNDTNYYIVMRVLPHEHYLCGGESCSGAGGHSCTTTAFDKWTNKTTLPTEGTYYLTDDVTLSTTHTVSGNLTLDLNGHKITMSGTGDAINVTGSFTLTDCKGGDDANLYGQITHSGANGRGVNINGKSASFTMYGGEISGNSTTASSDDGGGVNVAGTFYMYGGSITGNTTAGGNGGVAVKNGGTFEMSGDASVTQNTTTTGNGGGVYVQNSTFTMSDNAQITGNTASSAGSSGGGVFLYGSNSVFTMSGNAAIAKNSAGSGVGVYMTMGPKFNMNGGSISGNESTSRSGYGGGVYVDGTFTMTDGTIGGSGVDDGNMATYGGGVYISSSGTFHMEQPLASIVPSVYGNGLTNPTIGHGGGVYVNGTFEIAGNVHIDNNSDNVYLPGNEVIYITGDLKDIVPIGVTLASMPTGTTPITIAIAGANVTLTDQDRTRFFAQGDYDQQTYTVQLEGNSLKLYFGQPHKHTVCVGTDETDCTHTDVSFSALTCETSSITNAIQLRYDGNIVSSSTGLYVIYNNANLYLTDDIRIDGTIQINADVTLCLNGHSITSIKNNVDVIQIEEGKTLTLCDCRGGDTTKAYGKITHNTGLTGRGVTLDSDSTFIMYSGRITGNYVNTGGLCSGVYVPNGATFSVAGNASVTENNISNQKVATGTANVYLQTGAVINVIGKLGTDAVIGVTTEATPSEDTPVTIATAADNWIGAGNFTTDDDGLLYKVTVSDDGKTAQLAIHDHRWGIEKGSASNVLVERCAISPCQATRGTLTLEADAQQALGSSFGYAALNAENGWSSGTPTIYYERKQSDGTFAAITGEQPTAWGDYRAKITVNGVEATKEFSVTGYAPATSDFEFKAPSDLIYNGQPKVAEVTPKAGKEGVVGPISSIYYTGVDGTKYTTSTTPPTDAGKYEVSIDVDRSDAYYAEKGMYDSSWTFTISPAEQKLRYADEPVSKTYGDPTFKTPFAENTASTTISYESGDPSVAAVAADGTVTIVGAGTTTITATAVGTTNYKEAATSYTLTVTQKEITVSGITAEDKYYDTTTSVTFNYDNVVLTGKVENDDLSVTATGAFADANAGENKTVIITGLTLKGDKAGNYKLAADGQQTTAAATIKKMPLTIAGAAAEGRNYIPDVKSVTITGVTFKDKNNQDVALTKDTDYTVTGEMTDPDAGYIKAVTVKVKLSESIAKNYSLTSDTYNTAVTISMIDPTLPTGLTGWQGNALSTVTLPSGWTWKDSAAVMSETDDMTFSAAYAGDTNHKAGDYTVTVTVSAKKSAPLGNFTQPACTYGETLPDAAYDTVDGVIKTTIRYEGTANDGTPYGSSSDKPTKAGSYTVTVTCETFDTIYTGTESFTIAKKLITTPTPDPTKFEYNTQEQTYTLGSLIDAAYYTVSDTTTRTDAGSQDVTVQLKDKNNTAWNTEPATTEDLTYKFTIARKYIDLDVELSAYEFMYDGKAKTPGVTVYIYGTDTILSADEYTVVHSTIVDAGPASVTIKDTRSGNYSFSETYVNFTIKPSKLTLPSASAVSKTYDGTPDTTVTPGKLGGVVDDDDVSVAEISVSGSFDDQYVGTDKTVTFTNFTLTGTKAGNYTLTQPTVTGNITAANQEPAIIAEASVHRGGKTLDLNTLVSGVKANGTVTFVIRAGGEYAALSGLNGSTLTTKDNIGTVTITVTIGAVDLNNDDKPEYSEYTGTDAITVSVMRKLDPTVTAAPAGVTDLVYNGGVQTLIRAGSAEGGELQYKLGENGTYSKELPTAKNADTYTVYYKIFGDDDHEDSEEQSFTVTIQKAAVTITAKDKRVYAGSKVPVLPTTPIEGTDYTAEGLIGDDTLNIRLYYAEFSDLSTEVTPNTAKAGTYAIVAELSDAGDANYDVVFVTGTLTVRPAFGDAAVYPIRVSQNEHGTVTVSPKAAAGGSTVTITVRPDSDYRLDDLTVTDSQGNRLSLTDKGNGSYTFTMPFAPAEVSVRFAAETENSPFLDVSKDKYYYEAVKWAAEQGIADGIGNGLFGPERFCTRAQIVTFLWRAAGSPEPQAMSSFTDVPAEAYYAKAVAWAVEQGIAKGTGNGKFSPDAFCTRGQIVTFLWRWSGSPEAQAAGSFTDVSADAYYAKAIAWAVEQGIANGTGDGKFSPNGNCTRAQSMTFLWRLRAGK